MEMLKFRATNPPQSVTQILIPSIIIAPLLTCLIIGGSGLTLWLANFMASMIR